MLRLFNFSLYFENAKAPILMHLMLLLVCRNSKDDFNYYSQPAEGDHTISVYVSGFTSPEYDYWSKAGIMFRKSMNPSSPHVSIFLTGGGGVCTSIRSGARYGNPNDNNSESLGCVSTGVTSAWLKLEKRLDTYTTFIGKVVDGSIAWTALKSIHVPLIGDSYNAGLAVCSKRWYAAEAVFEEFYTDQYFFPSAAPSTSSAPTVYVPSVDIGSVLAAGSATESSAGAWTVKGSGSDIWVSTHFHFNEVWQCLILNLVLFF